MKSVLEADQGDGGHVGHQPSRAERAPASAGEIGREEKRQANRAAKQRIEAQEIAATSIPAVFRSEDSGGPGGVQVTGLLTSTERRLQQQQDRAQLIGNGALPSGRPSEFTPDEGDTICAWIQSGGSVRGYSRNTGRTVGTIYKWMRQNAGFLSLYAHACKDRADTLAEEVLEIADAAAINPTIEGVQAAKLRVEARKWIASKLSPTVWGDRKAVEHVGAVSIRIGISQNLPARLVEEVDGGAGFAHRL